MQDWLMLAEKDPKCNGPEYLHIKVRDSLAGFNRFSVDKTFTTWNNTTFYNKDDVVKEGTNYYISLLDNQINTVILAMTVPWFTGVEFMTTVLLKIHKLMIYEFGEDNQTRSTTCCNRYGHPYVPRQSLYRDVKEARQNFVYTVNSLLSEVNVIDENSNNWENASTALL